MDLLARQRALALGAATMAALSLGASPARADLADGFGVRPVVPKGSTTPPSYLDIDVKPGKVALRSVIASNGSKRRVKYRIDPVDGLTGDTSGSVYANRQDERTEAGTWLDPRKQFVTLDPGESKRVRFTISVPDDARPGDHLAGLAFENTATQESTKSRFSVKQVVRVVMGVQMHVAGGAPAQMEIERVKLGAFPGTQLPSTVVRMSNAGDVICKPKLRVSLRSESGREVVSEQQLDTVLAHDRINYPLNFRNALESGTYTAIANVSGCGAPREARTQAVLKKDLSGKLPSADGAANAEATSAGLPTWAAILIGALAASTLMALVLLVTGRRRRPVD